MESEISCCYDVARFMSRMTNNRDDLAISNDM